MVSPAIKRESRTYFEALGRHIASLRKARGMTQAELARAIGVSQQAVFAYELGERRVSVLIIGKLAKVFASSVEELIGMARPLRVPTGRLSPRAIRHAERLQALSKTQQRFVIRIIDVLEEQRNTQLSKSQNTSSTAEGWQAPDPQGSTASHPSPLEDLMWASPCMKTRTPRPGAHT